MFIIIEILLITAIILAIFYIKNKEISVEKLIADNKWEKKQEELKTKSEHSWEVSNEGVAKCSHCNKSYEIGEQIDYKPEGNGAKILLSKDLTGYTEDQIVTREEATWVVLGISEDGKGLLITTETPLNQKDSINFRGAQAYNTGVEALNAVARELYSNSKYGYARSMTIEDVNTYLGFENPTAQYTYIEAVNDEEKIETLEEEKWRDGMVGKWAKLDNLTTKVKELPTFESIIKNGTYTPDGANTKEALGGYCINSYVLQTSEVIRVGKCIVKIFGTDRTFEIDAEQQDFIFGVREITPYTYWLASKGVTVSIDFVAFGLAMIQNNSENSCVEMYDSRNETGLIYTSSLNPGIRPVVELYDISQF